MTGANKLWNLVIITADDLNADSMGWMGSTVGATPNIDAFAATCQQFRNCHTPVPICQPSRSVLMTGRWPHRNGASSFGPIRADATTLTEVMRGAGYFTAAINKIHHMMPPQKFEWDLKLEGSGKNPIALRDHFEQCLAAAAEKPFFINANSTDPHGPFATEQMKARGPKQGRSRPTEIVAPVTPFSESEIVIPPFLEDLPEIRQEIARYFSVVRRFDQSFGQLIDTLKAAGRMDDTVILFVSDHGISMPFSKATLYRHATWTPVLLRWPNMPKAGPNHDMVSSIDIMPTILDLLGLPAPDGIDGRSWLPRLRGELPGSDDAFTQIDAVNSGRKFPSRCIRTKTRAYIWNAWADGKTRFRIGTGSMRKRLSWKAIVEAAANNSKIKARVNHFLYRCPEEFYDAEKDPDERHNLIDDPRYRFEIEKMKALLQQHLDRTDDPLAGRFRRAQRPLVKAILRTRFRIARKISHRD